MNLSLMLKKYVTFPKRIDEISHTYPQFLEKIINTHVYIASSVELPSHPRNKMLDHALAELLGCAPNNHPLSLLFASSECVISHIN